LIGGDGRSPEPPDLGHQQVLHGVAAVQFGSEEWLYVPRNVRPHRFCGFSPFERDATLRKKSAYWSLSTYISAAPDCPTSARLNDPNQAWPKGGLLRFTLNHDLTQAQPPWKPRRRNNRAATI
jgi:hypothetical protein